MTSLNTESFASVLQSVGERPASNEQNVTRHYSERLSKQIALWLQKLLAADQRLSKVLPPEARVPTCYGKKSLDIGCLDASGYLALDISIKTFSFRDRATKRYTHNYTGRFYELLGESLDLRLSYPEAVLVAFIFLPIDSCDDATPQAASSFGNAVKQFSKIAGRGSHGDHALSFEYVFIGLYDDKGNVQFFDVTTPPPRKSPPDIGSTFSVNHVLQMILSTVSDRSPRRTQGSMNITAAFHWAGSDKPNTRCDQ